MLPTLIYGWMSFTYSLPLPTWPAKFFASKKQWAADRTVQESKMVPPHQWFPLPSHTPLALLSSLFNPCLIDTCHGIFDGASFPPTIRSALLKKLGMDAAKWKNRIGNLYQIVNYFKYPFLINYIPHVPDCLRIEFHGWIGSSLGWSAGPVHSFPLLHGWIGSSFGWSLCGNANPVVSKVPKTYSWKIK